MLTTIAYQFDGEPTYALEGSIFIAGAGVQWLRDGLKLIDKATDSGSLAQQASDDHETILVPAFTGLGAPYWKPDVRGALFGLTRDTGPEEIAFATLEAVCFQTRDLLEAMHQDMGNARDLTLRVDGGMAASDWTMQRLADITQSPVHRPAELEATAKGAAYLAAYQCGLTPKPQDMISTWQAAQTFAPIMPQAESDNRYAMWQSAVERLLG